MSRERLINSLIVFGLMLLGVWVVRHTEWQEVAEHSELQGAPQTNPFYAAQHFAELLGAKARARHDAIAVPAPQTVLVVGDWNWSIFPQRAARLESWVSQGGRLVAFGNLLDDERFTTWSGVSRAATRPNIHSKDLGTDAPAGPAREHLVQCGMSLQSNLLTTRKATWRVSDANKHAQALRIPIGRGSVTVVNSTPYTYETFLCKDNALLFARAAQLHRGVEVEFLSDSGSASLLALIWRRGAPVVALLGIFIALWLWRSGVRFGPLIAAPESARRSLAEQIRDTSQFTLRFGGGRALYAATVRAFDEAAAGRALSREQLTASEPGLAAALNDSGARRPNELRKAIVIIETARRRIVDAGQAPPARRAVVSAARTQ